MIGETATTRRRKSLRRLDEVLGGDPVIDVDPAEVIRADRDERDARDEDRANGHG
ncbi:hypothetical protein FHX42_004148 [Saccharopolyspora lacisalsi]|uniref:Uncharacterized protein n=1 Tax=Halosaccharopolyspora lacisalsi TaxID=1000566 RepID=A0A839E1J6_9PSEU|nr:hypothetical protein [Halosaccharopolyspora lacisalsi]MBA8826769.1 hypothetical protein [Halosaccharopolyspora lacisalsi]